MFGGGNTPLTPQSTSPMVDNIPIFDDLGVEDLHRSSNPIDLIDINEEL